jgi:hypothetical protein
MGPHGGRRTRGLPLSYVSTAARNGKYCSILPIRETNIAHLPLAVDHFRYFASCVCAQEGSLGELDDDTRRPLQSDAKPCLQSGEVQWHRPAFADGLPAMAHGSGDRFCIRCAAGSPV